MRYQIVVTTVLILLSNLNGENVDSGLMGQNWVGISGDSSSQIPTSSAFLSVNDHISIEVKDANNNSSPLISSSNFKAPSTAASKITSKPESSKAIKKQDKFLAVNEKKASSTPKPVTRRDIYGGGKPNSELKSLVNATQASGLISLYKKLGYSFIWLGDKKEKGITKELFDIVKNDKTLLDDSRSKKMLKSLTKRVKKFYSSSKKTNRQKALLDMDISKLYLNYAYYKVYGGINWAKFDEKLKELTEKFKVKVGWEYYRPPKSPIDIISEGASINSLKDVMNEATPKRFKYKKLEKKLVQYLDLAQRGGWKMLPKYKRVKPNRRSSIVPKIRKRLKLEDEAKKCATPNDENLYDKCLQKAVFRYKIRHGIKADKYIDNSLRKALNIPIHKKIAMMRLNLDRIKWLYRDEEPLRIELNIPSFRLNLYDRNKIITTIRAVVGRADHPTPIFHNVMKYVVVNPYWKIPESIVKHEMLRHLIKDPYYYDRRGKVLKKSWDENSKDVDPGKVNWKKYYRKRNDENMHIPYYFMQLPGSRNALGKIKFLFPNKYSVYIHDTPSKRLFFRTDRAFSHGCMRIQKPKELLKMLALYNENINVDKIMRKLGTTKKETISLEKTVPVDITYLTSYVDDYNNLHFRKDIYKYDKYQLENYKYPDLIGKIKKVLPKKKTQKKSQKPTPQNSNPHKKTNSQKRASIPAQNSPTTTKKPRVKEQASKPTPTPAPTQMPKDITPVTAGDSGDLF